MNISTSFTNIFQNIIEGHYNDNYRSRKYNEITYFKEIVNVLTTGCYWNRYKGIINPKVLHNKHIEYVKKGFYDQLFRTVINNYVINEGYYIYKYQSTDTSYVSNKFCSGLPRNKYYKSKRGVKISSINDSNGVPLSLIVTEGNVNDCKVLKDTFDNIHVPLTANKYANANKYKQHFLADKGYDTKEIRQFLETKGYNVIIASNRRNTKNMTNLATLSTKQKAIYKKRIVVENYYSWIKQFPKLMFVFEKSIHHYQQLLFIATSILIFNRFPVKCV